MSDFEVREKREAKLGDFYNWQSLLRPLGLKKDVFKAFLVTKDGEKVPVKSCEWTIENVHYSVLLQLDGSVILPVCQVEVTSDTEVRKEECTNYNEGLVHRLVTYLSDLGRGKVNKIKFISTLGHVIELKK